jgi:hypothetical protein
VKRELLTDCSNVVVLKGEERIDFDRANKHCKHCAAIGRYQASAGSNSVLSCSPLYSFVSPLCFSPPGRIAGKQVRRIFTCHPNHFYTRGGRFGWVDVEATFAGWDAHVFEVERKERQRLAQTGLGVAG